MNYFTALPTPAVTATLALLDQAVSLIVQSSLTQKATELGYISAALFVPGGVFEFAFQLSAELERQLVKAGYIANFDSGDSWTAEGRGMIKLSRSGFSKADAAGMFDEMLSSMPTMSDAEIEARRAERAPAIEAEQAAAVEAKRARAQAAQYEADAEAAHWAAVKAQENSPVGMLEMVARIKDARALLAEWVIDALKGTSIRKDIDDRRFAAWDWFTNKHVVVSNPGFGSGYTLSAAGYALADAASLFDDALTLYPANI